MLSRACWEPLSSNCSSGPGSWRATPPSPLPRNSTLTRNESSSNVLSVVLDPLLLVSWSLGYREPAGGASGLSLGRSWLGDAWTWASEPLHMHPTGQPLKGMVLVMRVARRDGALCSAHMLQWHLIAPSFSVCPNSRGWGYHHPREHPFIPRD